MLDRLSYRGIQRQRREAEHRKPPRKTTVCPGIISTSNESSYWPQAEGQLCQALIATDQATSQSAALDLAQTPHHESSRFQVSS
jgi:hypothetical protein